MIVDRVQCPLCSWTCLHHGKRSDGLAVTWRTPSNLPASANVKDRAYVRAFAYMRLHARGHYSDVKQGRLEVSRVDMALAFIPSMRKRITGETAEECESERRKRRREQSRESSRRYHKRLKEEKEEAKILEVRDVVAQILYFMLKPR